MASLNKVLLMGNLTRDIEMRYTPSGMAVAAMALAVNRKFRDTKTNELREEVTYVDIDAFGKTACVRVAGVDVRDGTFPPEKRPGDSSLASGRDRFLNKAFHPRIAFKIGLDVRFRFFA